MLDSNELRRESEVQQYFQSWQVAQGSSVNVALNVASISRAAQDDAGASPPASPDKALTAFAQLAVLRLHVKRAMVSLIDGTTQMILAEATRSSLHAGVPIHSSRIKDSQTSLVDAAQNNRDEGQAKKHIASDLWLGASLLRRKDAVCEHCIQSTCTAYDSEDETYTAAGLIIPDCRLDSRFQDRPYVRSEPGVRFYAGVPIISLNGHKIGAYAVSDEKARDGLTIDELQFMQGVAQAVSEHLEWARDRVDRFKGERIVRGMAAFIEDCPSLVENLTRTRNESTKPKSPNRASSRAHPTTDTLSTAPPESQPPNFRSGADINDQKPTPVPQPPSSPKKLRSTDDPITGTFHRATKILHDSTLADGVVLLEASPANLPKMRYHRESSEHEPPERNSSSPERYGNGDSDTEHFESGHWPSDKPCKILACSISDSGERAEIEQGSNLCVAELEKYAALFPKGKTFSFAQNGASLSPSDEKHDNQNLTETSSRIEKSVSVEARGDLESIDTNQLLKMFPGARLVIFIPLFDSTENSLAGGYFLWASVAGRMMNLDKHLSYLRAFGSSVMSEVARIKAQKNEAAKTTFIASMSHELRSPLHGILGAAEFLKDTNLNSHQSSLVNSVSACGKTLLDTLEHVLDFSKINKIGRTRMREQKKEDQSFSLGSGQMESLNATAVVDLAVLIEEVVDAIAAGYTLKKLPGANAFRPYKPNDDQKLEDAFIVEPRQVNRDGMVSVLLEICPNTSWLVRAQPGALRRVVMNLFGNSLKYTSSGFVRVSLRGEWNDDKSNVDILIQVTDTGKGISEDFQKSRLFIPFSQEDSFQPGTGLGLSIVKQIVDSLKGTIEIKSEKQKGTTVDVCFRLTPVKQQASLEFDGEMVDIIKQTKGRKLVLLEGESGTKHDANQQALKLEETLAETCKSWFGIEFKKEEETSSSNPDFYMYCEPPSMEALERRLDENEKTLRENKTVPIIIVCLHSEDAVRISQEQSDVLEQLSEIVELIPQPCGPRKLAKVFARCLGRVEKARMKARRESSSNTLTLRQKSAVKNDHSKTKSEHEGTEMIVQPYQPQRDGLRHDSSSRERRHDSPQDRRSEEPIQAEKADESTQSDKKSSKQRDKLHVCLVDDNEINLKLLIMFMKKCGFTYGEARNGQEALDKFKEEGSSSNTENGEPTRGFDVVLMDLSMPVMNGIDSTKRIRAYEHEKKLPPATIVALTGLATADAQHDAESAGMDYFMAKPVRFAELRKILSSTKT